MWTVLEWSWGVVVLPCLINCSSNSSHSVCGASWSDSGASWGIPGASWGLPGASWGLLGGLLAASWAVLGAPGSVLGAPGGVLGAPGGALGASWGALGAIFFRDQVLAPILGRLGAILGSSWAVLGALEPTFSSTRARTRDKSSLLVFRRIPSPVGAPGIDFHRTWAVKTCDAGDGKRRCVCDKGIDARYP